MTCIVVAMITKVRRVLTPVGNVDMPIVAEEATVQVHKIRAVADVDARREN